MGRFDDLDASIKRELALHTSAQDAVLENLENLRKEHEGSIGTWLQIVGEYYEAIRPTYADHNETDLAAVAQYKVPRPTQNPISERMKWGDTQYIYGVNFVPQRFPYVFPGYDEGREYRQGELQNRPGANPNVALHFELDLNDKVDVTTRDVIGLTPIIHMNVWGRIQKEEGDMVPDGVYFGRPDSAYDQWYTPITIYGDWENSQQTASNIEYVLRVVAPNVIDHPAIIKGTSDLRAFK